MSYSWLPAPPVRPGASGLGKIGPPTAVASCPHQAGRSPMSLLLGYLPWVEQVELDSPDDVGDAGLAGLSGGEVAGLLGFPGAGPAGAAADEESGHEDLQQERGECVIELVRGEKPRRCPSRRPGRAGS